MGPFKKFVKGLKNLSFSLYFETIIIVSMELCISEHIEAGLHSDISLSTTDHVILFLWPCKLYNW